MAKILVRALMYCGLLAASAPAQASLLRYTDINLPGGDTGYAIAISDLDVVVGTANSSPTTQYGFVWRNGITTLTNTTLAFYGVNIHGLAVAESYNLLAGVIYRTASGGSTVLHAAPRTGYVPTCINASNVVAGVYFDKAQKRFAFVRSGGQLKLLPPLDANGNMDASAINDLGTVAGTYETPQDLYRGYTYQNGSYSTFSIKGASQLYVAAIDGQGRVAGGYQDAKGVMHGFLRVAGVNTTIDMPGASSTEIVGFGAAGTLIGDYVEHETSHGFLYVNTVFKPLNRPGATETFVRGVNSHGSVVGSYIDAAGVERAFAGLCTGGPCK